MKKIIFAILILLSSNLKAQFDQELGPNFSLKVYAYLTAGALEFDIQDTNRYFNYLDTVKFSTLRPWNRVSTFSSFVIADTGGIIRPIKASNISLGSFGGSINWSAIPFSGSSSQYIDGTGAYRSFPSIPSYSAGTGISVVSNVITNTAPDQTVSISGGTGISTSGTYPNFVVTNSSPDRTVSITSGNGINTSGSYPNFTIAGSDYTNSSTATSGVVTYYLTSDKTSTGTALYSTIDGVYPIINDATANYTFGWSYNSSTKALSVTAKTNGTTIISLITVLTAPVNVTNGTTVYVLVKGH